MPSEVVHAHHALSMGDAIVVSLWRVLILSWDVHEQRASYGFGGGDPAPLGVPTPRRPRPDGASPRSELGRASLPGAPSVPFGFWGPPKPANGRAGVLERF